MNEKKCLHCGQPMTGKVPWCEKCGAAPDHEPPMPKPKAQLLPFVIAVVLGSYGGWHAFLSPTRDSLQGLSGGVLILTALGIVVNDLYSRELRGD